MVLKMFQNFYRVLGMFQGLQGSLGVSNGPL